MTLQELKQVKEKATPMMRQYLGIKEQYEDCIILYRLGDFYEIFFEDALLSSRILGIALTERSCCGEQKAPMCGVPAKAIDTYLPKLIEAGYKIGICEQLTPAGKEMVVRDIVRIITPGTVVESEVLDGGTNNFLAVVYKQKEKLGVSYLDISTGEFNVCEFEEDIVHNLNDLFAKVRPKEVLANEDCRDIENMLTCVKMSLVPEFTYCPNSDFNYEVSLKTVLAQLNTENLKEFNCVNRFLAITSAGVLLKYVNTTQKRSLNHINSINLMDYRKFMQIDANTRRNLELTENTKDRGKKGSLLWVLDKTKTNMGKRTLKNYIDSPLLNSDEINYRLNGVEELVKNIVIRESLRDMLSKMYDIERLTGKISYNNINPKDCLALCNSLAVLPQIKEQLQKLNTNIIKDVLEGLHDYKDVVNMLSTAIDPSCSTNTKDGGFIKKGFNKELDEIIDIQENSSSATISIETREKEATGIKNLKVGYNRIFGYYIEVPNSSVDMVPYRFIRKQTVANGERYITEELKVLEEKILHANDRRIELELELFNLIRSTLLQKVKNFQETSKAIGVLDTILSLATIAVERNYVKPIINKTNKNIEIIEGKHPVVETVLKNDFVPNDTVLDNKDNRTMLITGPNMAGKSTYMRQVALITIMAQIGSFVPAKSAKIALTDRVFTRIGASDDIMLGQSTFMVEMAEVSNILKYATNNSLILLDEVGRGTSTFDGLSIAWSIMEYIAKNFTCKTLFSTHFHELIDLEGMLEGIKNYKVAVKEFNNTIIFIRKIVRGSANKSFGLEVAALADLPEDVINRARQILHSLEQNDLNKNLVKEVKQEDENSVKYRRNLNEVAGIINDLDVNSLTPLNAFDILIQLKQSLNKK